MIIIRFSNNSGRSLKSFSSISRLMTSFFLGSRLLSASVVVLRATVAVALDDLSSNDDDGFFVSNRFRFVGVMPLSFDRRSFLGFGGAFTFAFC